MAWNNGGGAASQKVNKSGAIEAILAGIAEIDKKHNEGNAHHSYGKDCARLAAHIKSQYLNTSRNKSESARLSVTTLSAYLSDIRRAIKGANMKPKAITSDKTILPYDRSGTLRARYTLNGLIAAYPEYAHELEQIRLAPSSTAGLIKKRLLKRISDTAGKRGNPAYDAVAGLPVQHPIISDLRLTAEEKDRLKESSEDALSKKALAPTTIPYAGIQSIIEQGLTSEALGRQAFALALCCGRRAIELIYNAHFELTGDNRVTFYGQAKKGLGVDTKGYEIYTLIPAKRFLDAFETFRQHPKIKELHEKTAHLDKYQRGRELNLRTALPFNNAAKLCMIDIGAASRRYKGTVEAVQYVSSGMDVVFKDARAIYTRVCIDKFYPEYIKTRPMMKLAFAKTLLGHGEASTLNATESKAYGSDYGVIANYDAFSVDYDAPVGARIKAESKPTTDLSGDISKRAKSAFKSVTEAIEAYLASNPHRRAVGSRSGLDTLHDKVMAWASANPSRPITRTVLIKQIGAGRTAINDYMAITQHALASYNASRMV